MDADKLLVYLRYLRGRIDTLMELETAGEPEIASLQSELRLFRQRVKEFAFLDTKARELMGSVDVKIPAVHLAGSREHLRQTWWMNLPYFRRVFLYGRQDRDREFVQAKLQQLRDELYELYCLVKVSAQSS